MQGSLGCGQFGWRNQGANLGDIGRVAEIGLRHLGCNVRHNHVGEGCDIDCGAQVRSGGGGVVGDGSVARRACSLQHKGTCHATDVDRVVAICFDGGAFGCAFAVGHDDVTNNGGTTSYRAGEHRRRRDGRCGRDGISSGTATATAAINRQQPCAGEAKCKTFKCDFHQNFLKLVGRQFIQYIVLYFLICVMDAIERMKSCHPMNMGRVGIASAGGYGYARHRIKYGGAKQVWRVLVVEDDPQTREVFSGSVSRCAELRLAASVGTVAEAKAWLDDNANTVDVLLTDLGLPDGSGLEVIRHARRLNPACEPLVISMFGDEDNVLASIEAGALGYIHKDSTPDDIAQTILDMRGGASPISPMIARRVLSKYQSDRRQTNR